VSTDQQAGRTQAAPASLIIPRSAELLAVFETSQSSSDPVSGIAQRLLRHHTAQWQAEDRSRACADDDSVLAATKREIDQMNMARTRLVDSIDAWVAEHLRQDTTAALHTETLGSVIDRICIASVRSTQLQQIPNAKSRARLADQQLRELATAYDQLVKELLEGARRVPTWKALKSYGENARQ
jgi:hypothetical protein